MSMTHEERGLLLAVARVVRAQIRGKHHMSSEDMDDAKALTEALAPFDPKPESGPTRDQRKG
jgi:hypothetical protein